MGNNNIPIIYSIKTDNGRLVSCSEIHLPQAEKPLGRIHAFFEDKQNNIWIITGSGLLVKPYNQKNIELVSLALGTITGITEDMRGIIWIGTQSKGLFQLNIPKNHDFSHVHPILYASEEVLTSNHLRAICADLKGHLWIGTKEGNIIRYDILSHTFTDLSKQFTFMNESIISMLIDDFGDLWISTNKRLIEYDPVNQAMRVYTTTDGVAVSSFRGNSYYKDSSGKLYFGGNKGISAFNPSVHLSGNPTPNKVWISDIKINNQSLLVSNNNKNKLHLNGQTLNLEPSDKNIEINFSTLNYTFASKIRYAYKLEGVDNDWIYTDKNRQFATYSQLRKGSHRFHVKATDENNLWSDQVTELLIYKRPAYYETNGAYLLYVSCFLLAMFLVFRWTRNRIKLKNELRIAQIEKDKSEELTQVKLRYFTNITHDFLTPLTIVSCLIDDAEITSRGGNPQFKAMRSHIERLRRLLQQVLDFRKIESNNMKLSLSHGDIVAFIKQTCFKQFIPLMEKKEIDFRFHAEPAQIHAYFDTDKLDKILYNLLSNAEKYTPPKGQVGIELTLGKTARKDHLVIKVTDTGMGIPSEKQPHIFTRFYNNDIAFSGESNGIGLSLTKELVELHHGRIFVSSAPGKGSTFTVIIPIGKDSCGERESYPLASSIPEEKKNEPLVFNHMPDPVPEQNVENGTTILVVEDNQELLSLIANLLSAHYQIITASNGVEALSIIQTHDIDIIISDVMMPEMDGFELCITLKKNIETSHIPIILLTAKSSTEDRVECYKVGADAYISKPFQLQVLEARIQNFLTNRKNKQKEFRAAAEINISRLEYQTIDEQFLVRVVQVIEKNISDTEFDINLLANSLHISKSALYRKLKMMTGLSPVEFIRNIRLKHACQLLKNEFISIAEVTYQVGFSSPRYFATCFKNEFNMTPTEYQKILAV